MNLTVITQRWLITAVLFCCFPLYYSPSASADVIFSNLGPDNSYDPSSGSSLTSANNKFGSPAFSAAFKFTTPTQGTYALGRIIAPFQDGLSRFSSSGDIYNQPGPFALDLSLRQDNGGLPGSVLETIHYTGAIPVKVMSSNTLLPSMTFSSTLNPILQAGTSYWLDASVPSSSPYEIGWQHNSTGTQSISVVTRNSVSYVFNGTQAAFRIEGTSAVSPSPASPQQKTVGLFIGVEDGRLPFIISHTTPMDGDGMATEIYNSFKAKNQEAEILTANILFGGLITKEQIRQKLAVLKGKMNPGDGLVFYANAHGGGGIGVSELLALGSGLGNGYLYDTDLYDLLKEFDPNGYYRKVVYLDACRSGGFGTTDSGENTALADLTTLKNTVLYAAAKETENMYYDKHGHGFFSQVLDSLIDAGLDQTLSAEEFGHMLSALTKDRAAKYGFDQEVFYEGEFGDAVPVDENLVNPFWAASPDFNTIQPLVFASIPAPETYILILTSLGLLGLSRRGMKKIYPD